MKKCNILYCSKFISYRLISKKGYGKKTKRNIEGLKVDGKERHIYKLIDYNTFEDKETKVSSLYKLVKLKKDWIKKYYCDSSKILLKQNNEEYKKIKIETKGFFKYFIHDNGGRPFLSYVGKHKVFIYKRDEKQYYTLESDYNREDKKNTWMYTKLIKIYKPLEIFIGKSFKNKITEFGKWVW
jgi:hypothetical protein